MTHHSPSATVLRHLPHTVPATRPLGFLAESLGYRLTVGLCIACREATRVLLIYGSGVRAMAAMQGTYAVAAGMHSNCLGLDLYVWYTITDLPSTA